MIASFADTRTEDLFNRHQPKGLDIKLQRAALRKLAILDAATGLADLKVPPGNRLELLRGDRAGQHSIRVNNQYRICFRWHRGNAFDVEVMDYH